MMGTVTVSLQEMTTRGLTLDQVVPALYERFIREGL